MNVLSRLRSYGILAAAAIVFAASVFFSVDRMLTEQSAQTPRNTENVAWAATRAEINLYLFLDAIGTFASDESPMSQDELVERFAALRDQVAMLRSGRASEALQTLPRVRSVTEAIIDELDRIEVALSTLRKPDKAAVTRLKDQAMRLAQPLHTLSAEAIQLDEATSSLSHRHVQQVYIELIGFFIGILVSGGILIFLLFRGVRRAQRLLDERQAAEDQLRDSEQRFRDFAASASDWLWDTDARLRFTHFSQNYLDQIGVASAMPLGKTFDEVAHLDSDETKWVEFQELLARRQPFREIQFHLRDGGGATRTIKMNGVPAVDSNGEFIGYRGTGNDITDQVEAEREADRVRTLLSEAVESLDEGFIICDPNDQVVLINNNFRRLYPKSSEAIRAGALFEDIVRDVIRHGEVVIPSGQEDAWVRDRLDQHRNPRGPHEQRLADGRWVQVNEQVLANGWHIGTRVDITQLKQREEALRREALIWEQISEGVIITNLTGTITNWNPAAESVFGYAAAEMLGRAPDLLYGDQSRGDLTTSVLKSVRRDGRWAGQINFTRKDGRAGIAETVVVPLRTDNGHLVAAIWVNEDVTERKRYEEALRAAKEQAESANIAKSQFLATMSHEIRTPMNGVLGMLDLLLHTPLSEEQHRYTAAARESGEGLLVVIDDILDFSKMEAGKLVIESMDFDLRDLVEAILDLLTRQAQAKGVEISALIEPNVPTLLRGDPGRLRQVILNLMGNAVKFTERGGVAITIQTLRAADERVEVRFEIKDTGIGIAEDRKTEMFKEFTQADPSTTRRFGGTGLGLAISKKLIELMKGRIGFESEVGKGSTFWFVVEFERQPGTATVPDIWDNRIGTRRMLIGDGNALSGQVLRNRLASHGQIVEHVADRASVIRALEQAAATGTPYELVLIDELLIAPDLAPFCDAIRRHPALYGTPKLVLIFRIADSGRIEAVHTVGFDDHLKKPIHQHALLSMLRRIFDLPADSVSSAGSDSDDHDAEPVPAGSRRARLLLAEDSAVNQVVAIAMLNKSGYSIDSVENGTQAIEAVKARSYDLILMDVSMPEMDGLEATKAIRALSGAPAHIPVIAMTAHALESDREKCLAAGMNDYIAKPVNRKKLLEVVARWIRPTPSEPGCGTAESRPALQLVGGRHTAIAQRSAHLSDTAEASVLDATTLRQLEADTNVKVLAELITTYISETLERLHRMDAVASGDLTALGCEAHALKSSSGTFGAFRLQALAHAIEIACREQRAGDASALLQSVHAASAEAIAALRAHLPSLQVSGASGLRT